jgi:hypothetical protein
MIDLPGNPRDPECAMPLPIRSLAALATLIAVGAIAVACHDIMPPEPGSAPVAADVATATTHVAVTPDSMHGWVFVDDQHSVVCTDPALCRIAAGPSTPPLGNGSAELATPNSADGIALILQGYGGTRLDQITELHYATYRQTSDAGNNLAVALQLTADFDLSDGSNAWQGRLVFEPYHASGGQVVQANWQVWDTKVGKWWGTRATVVRNGVSTANPCVQSSPCTWAQLLAAFPNAGIHVTYGSVILKAGSGWTGFRGNVDALAFGVSGATTTYDFELTPIASVPALPPDSVPQWIHADTNVIDGGEVIAGPIAKHVIVIAFDPVTSLLDRAAAIASVGGTVVGGVPTDTAEGFYYVSVPQAWTPSQIVAAAETANAMAGVVVSAPAMLGEAENDYRRPIDAGSASDWRLEPDSADGDNWALERIGAPLAWGCSTGDPSVRVSIIDQGFHDVEDLRPNVQGSVRYSSPTPGSGHGTSVASIVAARGNNGIGMTGVMWTADLRLFERDPTAAELARHKDPFMRDIARMTVAVLAGSHVINVSGHTGRFRPDSAGRAGVAYQLRFLRWVMRLRNQDPRAPLFVFSAGNNTQDAYYNGYPAIALEYPSRVLVVAAAAATGGGLEASSNFGSLVQIAAPGERLQAINEAGVLTTGMRRTSGAAPYVTGVAGLLAAFDPTLTTSGIRDLIVAGAIVGGRSAAGIPLLNAYESLRLAAGRRGAPLCGNRIWVDDNGTVQVARGSITEPLVNSVPGALGDYLYVPHGGRQVLFSTEDGEGFFEWNSSSHVWAPSSQDFWDLPDSVTANLYGRTRAQGWDHDRLLDATTVNNGIGVTVKISDTARFSPRTWTIGRIPSGGILQAQAYAKRRELDTKLVCMSNDSPCTTVEVHVEDDPYPVQWITNDNYAPITDRSYSQGAFSMLGDSIFVTHVPITETQTLTEWAPCPNNTGFVDGYAYSSCRSPVSAYAYGTVTVQSLPASSEAMANATTQSHLFAWSNTAFLGRAPLWITNSESGEELVIADGIRSGSVPFPTQYTDCRIRWIAKATGVVLQTVSSQHSCTSRGVGTVAPRIVGSGASTVTQPRDKKHLVELRAPRRSGHR